MNTEFKKYLETVSPLCREVLLTFLEDESKKSKKICDKIFKQELSEYDFTIVSF